MVVIKGVRVASEDIWGQIVIIMIMTILGIGCFAMGRVSKIFEERRTCKDMLTEAFLCVEQVKYGNPGDEFYIGRIPLAHGD